MVALNGRHFANSRELCELRVINWQFNVHCYAFICCLNKNQKGYISFAVIVLSRIWFVLYDVFLRGSISCILVITRRFNMNILFFSQRCSSTRYLLNLSIRIIYTFFCRYLMANFSRLRCIRSPCWYTGPVESWLSKISNSEEERVWSSRAVANFWHWARSS